MYNNGDGCVNPDVFKENASSFYGNTTSAESRPFSENVYDGSPLDRVKAVYGVGQDWFSAGKCAETEFLTNSTDVPTLKCLNLKVEEYSDTSFTVKKAGFYPASTLLVTKSMDEDGNTAYSFTDFSGKTLLERRVLSSDKTADTYYVYDDFGDLRAVIPPMLSKEVSTSTSTHWTSDSEPFGRWAFLYVYDSRHRCVAKKMPGAGWNLTLYDKAGNAILTQDARQREQNEWAFNIPDALGRVCLQGLCEESSLFGNDTGIDVFSGPFQNVAVRAFRSQGSLAATSAFYGYSIDGMVIDSTTTFLTVNYYDDHSFVGMYGFPHDLLFDEALVDNGYGNRWSSAHNLLTGSMSAVITSEGVSPENSGTRLYFMMSMDVSSRPSPGTRMEDGSERHRRLTSPGTKPSQGKLSLCQTRATLWKGSTHTICGAGSKERQRVFRMAAGLTHPAQSAIRMTMSEGWLESLTALEPMLSTSPWPTTLGAG